MKRLIVFVLLTTMILLVSNMNIDAAGSGYTLAVTSDLSTSSDYYIVNVDIESKLENFSGTMRVVVENDKASLVGYETIVSVPKGNTKTYSVDVPVKGLDAHKEITIYLYNTSGKKVYSEKFRSVFGKTASQITLGLLSDNPDKISALDMGGETVEYYQENYQVKLEEIDLDDISDQLARIDVLVINNYDTSSISEEVIEEIEDWVNYGGILFIGTGRTMDRTVSGFDDGFLGIESRGTYRDEKFYTGNDYAEHEVVDIDYTLSYTGISNVDNYINIGSGYIIHSTFDLEELTEDDNYNLNSLYNFILSQLVSSSNYNPNNNFSMYDLEDFQGYMEKPVRTGAGLLSLIIIIYIVLVGPICYLVLKSMKMQEKIWIVIPIMSLVFVGFVALLSLGVKVRGLNIKTVEMHNISNNTDDVFILGYSAKPKEWTIETKDSYLYGNMITDFGYSDSKEKGIIQYGGEVDWLTYKPEGTFESTCFVMTNKDKKIKDFTYDVEFDDVDNNGLQNIRYGKITNNTGKDFDFVMIIGDYGNQLIKDVQDGEEMTVAINKSSYGYQGYSVSNNNLIYNGEVSNYYRKKDYEGAAELSAMAMTLKANCAGMPGTLAVVGVTKGSAKTKVDSEAAWECYYSEY